MVLDKQTSRATRALNALAVLSGGTEPNNTIHPVKQAKPKIKAPEKGTFWPIVRERMKEKAMQLYLKEHSETQTLPELKELRKTSYMQEAKKLVLREMQAEKRKV